MLYIPISVRFVTDSEVLASSGVHLVTATFDRWVTVAPTPYLESLSIKQVLLNSPYINNGSDTVNWIDVGTYYSIESVDERVTGILGAFARDNGFVATPSRNVSLVSGTCSKLAAKVGLHRYKQLVLEDSKVENGTPCVVRLCPFNLTNSLMFSTYVAHGSLTTQLSNGIGYLSDIKYLENMAGGAVAVASLSRTSSYCDIGLVAQHLRKSNGDGDLVVVLLWREVLQTLEIADGSNTGVAGGKYSTAGVSVKSSSISEKFPVFPVRTMQGSNGHTSWGSCVLYKQDTLVTNTHVLAPYIEDPMGTAVVLNLPDGPLTILPLKHTVNTPSALIDISFITLSESDVLRLVSLRYFPVSKSNRCRVGQAVASVGYGLFLPPRWQDPVVSQGTVDLAFNTSYLHGTKGKLPSLIITSASCWNGSSGGGLFRDNELIGIICSNAEVRVDGQPMEEGQNAEVEKLTRFVFAVPVALIDYLLSGGVIDTNGALAQTWRLEAFHEDRVLPVSKL